MGSISNTASIATSARETGSADNTDPVTTLVQRPTSTLLTFFTASAEPGVIQLHWETASEITLVGFNLYRANSVDGILTKVNPDQIDAELPGDSAGNTYVYMDQDVAGGSIYYYWIELITTNSPYINGPISATALYSLHLPMLSH